MLGLIILVVQIASASPLERDGMVCGPMQENSVGGQNRVCEYPKVHRNK